MVGVMMMILSMAVALMAVYVMVFKGHHFVSVPHESDLDDRSWWISKLAHVVVERPFPTNTSLGVAMGRLSYQLMTTLADKINLYQEPDLLTIPFQEISIAVPGSYANATTRQQLDAQISLRIYNGEGVWKSNPHKKRPVLIWYHGGGCVVGAMEQDHVLSLILAKESDFLVVNVDYRLAPEYVFPTGVEDSYSAFEWVLHNIDRYGGDPQRIILGGESAGGSMASAVASKYLVEHPSVLKHTSPIVGLYLVYPALAPYTDMNDEEVALIAETNGLLPVATIEHFRSLYAGTSDLVARNNYLLAPLLTPVHALERYPSTLFVLAKYDVLAKESHMFADRLRAVEIEVDVLVYPSTIHAFFGKELVSPVGRVAVTESIDSLRKLLKLQNEI